MLKFIRMLFSRLAFVVLFMLLQIAALILLLTYFRAHYAVVQTVFVIFSAAAVVYILNQNSNPAFKMAWIITIMLLPIFGTPMYLLFGQNRLPEDKREELCGMRTRYNEAIQGTVSHMDELREADPDAAMQAAYLENRAAAPLYTNTQTTYFRLGEDMFREMLEAISDAERFIFLEYFIIDRGYMWDSILEVLTAKAAQGVDVRVIYDDMGCILTLPADYDLTLEKLGIKCCSFHRFQPVLTGTFNNRDHRKICVVDGHTAFTGGINLADEYINRVERFGHWLDCGVMLRGEAAFSFTAMFLSMWDYILGQSESAEDFRALPEELDGEPDGFVQPYHDTPSDDEPVGETAYINMISRAKKYVYICTPYLVIDNEMITALGTAAKSGVDVRIITPGVPDKWYVNAVTHSYFGPLLRAGVRVYEYTPGFIHSKTFVCDDEYGICGTINLDYRSLFLHHECAVWMYRSAAVMQMKDAYMRILPHCAEVTPAIYFSRPWYQRLVQNLLQVFSPIM